MVTGEVCTAGLRDIAIRRKDGGRGLLGDLALGLVGSIIASLLFRALGISPGAAPIAWVVASSGAVLVILSQRMFWHGHA